MGLCVVTSGRVVPNPDTEVPEVFHNTSLTLDLEVL